MQIASHGPMWPATIATVEIYAVFPTLEAWGGGGVDEYDHAREVFYAQPLATRRVAVWYELTLAGQSRRYASLAEAETVALRLLDGFLVEVGVGYHGKL